MRFRSAVLWGLSAAMFLWIVALTVHTYRSESCREQGGAWSWQTWRCRIGPAIEIRRHIERG